MTKALGDWAPGPMPPAPPPLPSPAPDTRRVLIVDRADLVQNTIVLLAHDGIGRPSQDRAGAQLLNKVVEDGTVLMAHGEVRMYREGGSYRLSAITHSSKVRRVVDQLLSELERVRRQPIPGPELEQARAQVLARFSRSLPHQRAVFSALLDLDLYGMPDHSLEDYRSQILEATPADLVQQARRLLHPDRAAIILVGPAERLLPQLDGLGPVEVVDYSPTAKELNVPSVPTPPRPSDESARGENDAG